MHLQDLQRRLALAVANNPATTHITVPIAAIRGAIRDMKAVMPADVVVLPVVEMPSQAPKAKAKTNAKVKVKQAPLPKRLSGVPGYADLSVRAKRVLEENRVRWTRQLTSLSENDLHGMRGMGTKSVAEVAGWAKNQGIRRG